MCGWGRTLSYLSNCKTSRPAPRRRYVRNDTVLPSTRHRAGFCRYRRRQSRLAGQSRRAPDQRSDEKLNLGPVQAALAGQSPERSLQPTVAVLCHAREGRVADHPTRSVKRAAGKRATSPPRGLLARHAVQHYKNVRRQIGIECELYPTPLRLTRATATARLNPPKSEIRPACALATPRLARVVQIKTKIGPALRGSYEQVTKKRPAIAGRKPLESQSSFPTDAWIGIAWLLRFTYFELASC